MSAFAVRDLVRKCRDVRSGRAGQTSEIVTTLKNAHDPALRGLFRNAPNDFCEIRKVPVCEQKITERVSLAGVEPRANEHQLRAEFFHRRHQLFFKSAEDFIPPAA